jgi:hypothetical protein
MLKSDEAVVRLLPTIGKLIERGFKPEWVSSTIRPYVRAAASLHLRGHEITPLAVELLAGSSDRWPEVERLFGAGGVEPEEAVDSAMANHMRLTYEPVHAEINNLLTVKPEEIAKWLPERSREINSICQRGSVYDPTPSKHFRSPIPQIVKTFNNFLDGLLRGGIYNGALAVLVAAPSGGKSTTAYTLVAACVDIKAKVVLITGEELESTVVARVLMAMTGMTMEKVLAFHSLLNHEKPDTAITEAEYATLETALNRLDRHFVVYDKAAMELGAIDDIIAWESPYMLIIDHIMMVEDKSLKRTGSTAFDIGALFYGIQHITMQKYRIHTVIMSQTKGSVAEALKAGKMPKHVFPFGSSMGDQAAGSLAVLARHPGRRGFSRLYFTKDKLLNQPTDIYAIEHNEESHSFVGAQRDVWS